MYDYDLKEIEKLTGLPPHTRKSLSHFYANLPEKVKAEAHKIHSDLIRQNRLKQTKGKQPEFLYAFFLLALHKMQTVENSLSRKQTLSDEDLRRLEIIRKERIKAGHKKKPQKVKNIVGIRYYEMIRKMRSEDISWRDISDYIARFHKKRISHTYLKKCFTELTEEKKIQKQGL